MVRRYISVVSLSSLTPTFSPIRQARPRAGGLPPTTQYDEPPGQPGRQHGGTGEYRRDRKREREHQAAGQAEDVDRTGPAALVRRLGERGGVGDRVVQQHAERRE